MDQNELVNQLSNNPQLLSQILQMMQQNGMIQQNQPPQRSPMNWNVPTNPMAAVWWNNMMNALNSINNQGNNQQVSNNNQTQQNAQTEQQSDDILPIRIIKSEDDIVIDQIPVSNKITLFMKDDMSVIYGKRWTNNGEMKNLRFILEENPEQNSPQTQNNSTVNNQGFNVEELMAAVTNIIDSKLEQFKKDYRFDNRSQSKNRNNRKGGELDGK